MKISKASFLFLALLGAFVVGCGSGELRTSTEDAEAQDILDYEAAVAASEQQSTDAGLENTED